VPLLQEIGFLLAETVYENGKHGQLPHQYKKKTHKFGISYHSFSMKPSFVLMTVLQNFIYFSKSVVD